MNRMCACATALVLVASGTSGIASAGDKDSLNIEEGVLDEIRLKVPTISSGVPILIRPFSTGAVDLGTGGEDAKNEKRSEATRTMLKVAPELLMEALRSGLLESHAFGELLPAGVAKVPGNALVIEGRFTRIDPGSRAKRYWGGFGAGKSGIQVTGTVKDASGEVLAEFTHMKHSGIGIGGGDYVKFLSDDTKDVGTTWRCSLPGGPRAETFTRTEVGIGLLLRNGTRPAQLDRELHLGNEADEPS